MHSNTQETICFIARCVNASTDFQSSSRARSKAKRLKCDKYAIPLHLFHPITARRTNVLSADALSFCQFMSIFFPVIHRAFEKTKAAISAAIVMWAASTMLHSSARSSLRSMRPTRLKSRSQLLVVCSNLPLFLSMLLL